MDNMKRIVVIVVSCMTIVILTGCTLIHGFIPPESKLIESYTLNERQKKILSKEGLPTEYEDLSLSQKISINAIVITIYHIKTVVFCPLFQLPQMIFYGS